MTQNFSFRTPPNSIKFNYKQNFFSSLEKLNSLEKNHWVWLECNYFLKYSPDKKNISYLNLTPFHKIHNMMGSVQTSLAYPNVEITMEKNIIFDTSLGWNWHKSWILPMITVKLLNFQDYDLEENKIFAKLFVVKAGLQETETFYLVDIGIKGDNKIYLKNSVASFNNLKFASTSYNNEGLKFHLVVALFYEINNSGDFSSTSNLRIIESKLSPPIYVDSRKSARDNLTNEVKIFDYFNPDMLVKPLIKRRKKEGEICEDSISNSFKGFINYYTAANIRNKVKHPFFPALRFSNCISLYYNKEYFKNMDLENVIDKILNLLNKLNENVLFKEVKNKKVKNKIIINNINENAYLTIFIKNPKDVNFSKKVSEFLTSFDQRVINIVCNSSQNLNKFQEITDLNILGKVYKSLYEKNATNSVGNDHDDDNDNDNESDKSFRTSSSHVKQKDNQVEFISTNMNSSSNFHQLEDKAFKQTITSEIGIGQSSTQNQKTIIEGNPTIKQENISINPKVEAEITKNNNNANNNNNNNKIKIENNLKSEEVVNNNNLQQEYLNKLNMQGLQSFQNNFLNNPMNSLSMMQGRGDQQMNLQMMNPNLNINSLNNFNNNFNNFITQNNNNFPFMNHANLNNIAANMGMGRMFPQNPNSMSNTITNAMTNAMANPLSNQMANPMANPNQMTNTMANSMTNPNAMGSPMGNPMANPMTNPMASQLVNQMSQMQNLSQPLLNFNQNQMNFLNNQQMLSSTGMNHPNMTGHPQTNQQGNMATMSNFMENMQNKNNMNNINNMNNMTDPKTNNNLIINQQIQQINNNNLLLNLSQVQARKAQLANDILMFKNLM